MNNILVNLKNDVNQKITDFLVLCNNKVKAFNNRFEDIYQDTLLSKADLYNTIFGLNVVPFSDSAAKVHHSGIPVAFLGAMENAKGFQVRKDLEIFVALYSANRTSRRLKSVQFCD